MPKLAIGELLHLYKYPYAFIAGKCEIDRTAARFHFAIHPQSSLFAVTIQYNKQEQLHIGLGYGVRFAIPKYAPAALIFYPVAEFADDIMNEPHQLFFGLDLISSFKRFILDNAPRNALPFHYELWVTIYVVWCRP